MVPLAIKYEHTVLIIIDKVTVTIFIIDYIFRLITVKQKLNKGTVLFLLATVCLALHFSVNPTIVREVSDDAAIKIAESWLDKQISLRDYEITEAHFFTFEDPQTKYVAMTYSVKPYENARKDWYAGNGETGADGWLIEKHGFISFRRFGSFVITGTVCDTGP